MDTVANLKDSNEELRGLVAQLQKRQQETEAKLKSTSAALSLAQIELQKQRTSPAVVVPNSPAPFSSPPMLSPLLLKQDKKKKIKDLTLPDYTDGGETEKSLRESILNLHDPTVREARKDHNRLFEHLLWSHYKCKEIIVELKLPPIAGATKSQIQAYNSGSGRLFMSWDMVTACIKIARELFPLHFLDTRDTRRKLQSLLENFQKRLSGKVPKVLKIQPHQEPEQQLEYVEILPQPGPAMQVVRDTTVSLVTLNATADRSDSSLDVTQASLPSASDSYLDDLNAYDYYPYQ